MCWLCAQQRAARAVASVSKPWRRCPESVGGDTAQSATKNCKGAPLVPLLGGCLGRAHAGAPKVWVQARRRGAWSTKSIGQQQHGVTGASGRRNRPTSSAFSSVNVFRASSGAARTPTMPATYNRALREGQCSTQISVGGAGTHTVGKAHHMTALCVTADASSRKTARLRAIAACAGCHDMGLRSQIGSAMGPRFGNATHSLAFRCVLTMTRFQCCMCSAVAIRRPSRREPWWAACSWAPDAAAPHSRAQAACSLTRCRPAAGRHRGCRTPASPRRGSCLCGGHRGKRVTRCPAVAQWGTLPTHPSHRALPEVLCL